jgi:hypothetical protein
MTLSQVFRNTTKRNMEVVYTFPVAWGAVLLGLDATLGGQRRSGQVMAKQTATQNYEAAIEKGDAPIMVEKNPGGSYTASLGSLKPGEEAVLTKTTSSGISITNAAGGIFQVSLTAADTAGLSGAYYFEAQVTDAGSNVSTVTTGTLTVNTDIA